MAGVEAGAPSLRERKKVRTQRELAEAALELFLSRGFHAVTLDELVEHVEVSRRTFFRYYAGKEHVATAAETQLWDAYVAEFAATELNGPVLATLHRALIAALRNMDEDWERRFVATRGLIARTPALRDHSNLTSLHTQERLVDELERKLGLNSRTDVRLRLLGELALGTWRCAARNWIRVERQTTRRGRSERASLIHKVDEAYDAIADTLTLAAP